MQRTKKNAPLCWHTDRAKSKLFREYYSMTSREKQEWREFIKICIGGTAVFVGMCGIALLMLILG